MKALMVTFLFFTAFSSDSWINPEAAEVAIIPEVGKTIDSYNNMNVYYNGEVNNVIGRNVTYDNYNLGLKYQCVEYVKRYYYYVYDHKMNNSFGHAKEYFDVSLPDRKFNKERGLYQFTNGSEYRPVPGDVLIFDGNHVNPFGHIGIVTFSEGSLLEIIQQNVGESTRARYVVENYNDRYYVNDDLVLGWLRK